MTQIWSLNIIVEYSSSSSSSSLRNANTLLSNPSLVGLKFDLPNLGIFDTHKIFIARFHLQVGIPEDHI